MMKLMISGSRRSTFAFPSDNVATQSAPLNRFGRDVIVPFLITRLAMLVVAFLAIHRFGDHVPSAAEFLSRHDGLWYLKIARDGYFFDPHRQSSIAFAPLLPMLMRVGGALLGSSDFAYLAAGACISNFALLVGLGFIRQMTAERFGDRASRLAVVYVLLCPGAIFLSTVYPMSLMLAIGAGALWAAKKGRWELASAIGMLAPLARPDGVLLFLPLLYQAARAPQAARRRWWLLMIPAMSALWLAGQWLAFGTPLAFIRAQQMWEPSPFITVFHSSRAPLILGMAALFVLLTMWGWLSLPVEYSIYSTLYLAITLGSGRLWSLPRFVVILFPAFIALSCFGSRWKWLHLSYLVVSTLLCAWFVARFSLGLWVA